MYYETEGTETTSNAIQLKSRETTQSSRYQYVSQDSGGNGNGDNRPQLTEPVTPEPQPEPETPPTPTPTPEPVPTPQDSEPEPKPEPTKPVKKVKKAKKAALPATGDDAVIAVAAGVGAIALAFVIASRLVRKEQ